MSGKILNIVLLINLIKTKPVTTQYLIWDLKEKINKVLRCLNLEKLRDINAGELKRNNYEVYERV